MSSPTARTLEECRERGWTAEVSEYWQPSFAQVPVVDAAKALCGARTPAAEQQAKRSLQDAVMRLARSGPGKRHDLFGFLDVVACGAGAINGIQCTDSTSVSHRYTKIIIECREAARAWIANGGKLFIVGWKKYDKPIDRRYWRSTWREVTQQDLDRVTEQPKPF